MTRRHIHLLVLLAAVAIASGCSTPVGKYFHNRSLDAMDCAGIQAGIGLNVPVCIGVEVTRYVPIGVGGFVTGAQFGELFGFVGRTTGGIELQTWDLPFNIWMLLDQKEKEFFGGTMYSNYKIEGSNPKRSGRLGVHCGVLLLYVAADIELIEIADFFTGIFGYDLTGDDESPLVFNAKADDSKEGK